MAKEKTTKLTESQRKLLERLALGPASYDVYRTKHQVLKALKRLGYAETRDGYQCAATITVLGRAALAALQPSPVAQSEAAKPMMHCGNLKQGDKILQPGKTDKWLEIESVLHVAPNRINVYVRGRTSPFFFAADAEIKTITAKVESTPVDDEPAYDTPEYWKAVVDYMQAAADSYGDSAAAHTTEVATGSEDDPLDMTTTEYLLLKDILASTCFPFEFEKHLRPESRAAFDNFKQFQYIEENYECDGYIVSEAGRSALIAHRTAPAPGAEAGRA